MDDKAKGLEAGVDEFINKPIQKIELLTRIRSLILHRQLREQYRTRVQDERRPEEALSKEGPSGQPPVQQKILIAEADPKDAGLLQHFLQQMPLEVEIAASGEEVLRCLENKDIDLVLLDIHVSGIDAFEICRSLKAGDRTRRTQILFICGLPDLEDKMGTYKTEADDLLIKPINEYELRVRTANLLKKKIYLDGLRNIGEISSKGLAIDPPDPLSGVAPGISSV